MFRYLVLALGLIASSLSFAQSININTATVEEFTQLKGIGQSKAEAIVAYREMNNGFKSLEDMKNVKGIGPKFIEMNSDQLSVSDSAN